MQFMLARKHCWHNRAGPTVEQLKMQAATTQARAEAEVMLAKAEAAEAAEAKAEAVAAKLASPTSSGPMHAVGQRKCL